MQSATSSVGFWRLFYDSLVVGVHPSGTAIDIRSELFGEAPIRVACHDGVIHPPGWCPKADDPARIAAARDQGDHIQLFVGTASLTIPRGSVVVRDSEGRPLDRDELVELRIAADELWERHRTVAVATRRFFAGETQVVKELAPLSEAGFTPAIAALGAMHLLCGDDSGTWHINAAAEEGDTLGLMLRQCADAADVRRTLVGWLDRFPAT